MPKLLSSGENGTFHLTDMSAFSVELLIPGLSPNKFFLVSLLHFAVETHFSNQELTYRVKSPPASCELIVPVKKKWRRGPLWFVRINNLLSLIFLLLLAVFFCFLRVHKYCEFDLKENNRQNLFLKSEIVANLYQIFCFLLLFEQL